LYTVQSLFMQLESDCMCSFVLDRRVCYVVELELVLYIVDVAGNMVITMYCLVNSSELFVE